MIKKSKNKSINSRSYKGKVKPEKKAKAKPKEKIEEKAEEKPKRRQGAGRPHGSEVGPTNEEIRQAIIGFHGRLTAVSTHFGIDHSTLHLRMRKHPELKKAWLEAPRKIIEVAELVLFKRVKAGDQRAIEFLLSRLGKKYGWSNAEEDAKDSSRTLGYAIEQFEKKINEMRPAGLIQQGEIIDIEKNAEEPIT